MLKIIDVSGHQPYPFTGAAATGFAQADGVIVKTTEGTGYVNPYADRQYQAAKQAGKVRGFYHYARGTDPVAEANYFVAQSRGYFNDGIPFLDWEQGGNASWGNTTWCRRFVDRVHALTGVWCGVYIQASSVAQAASCAPLSCLWIAGYPRNGLKFDTAPTACPYSTGAWDTWTLWQFSGDDLDRNWGNLDRAAWQRIACATAGATVSTSTNINVSNTIKEEIMAGTTHLIFQAEGSQDIFIAYLMTGRYRRIGTMDELKNLQYILKKCGLTCKSWREVNGGSGSGYGTISKKDLACLGKRED